MDLGYSKRRVLVVGGSEGIGFAAAALMAGEGADVIIASRAESKLKSAAEAIRAEYGAAVAYVVCDVTKPDGGAILAKTVEETWGALDAVIAAVGGSIRSEFSALDDEAWIENYNFNVLSTVRTVRSLIPLLEKGDNPAIVTLSGAGAKMPYPHQSVSNVHKAGVIALTKTLSLELAASKIRVNCVAPGRTLTSLWTNRADTLAQERGSTREAVIEEFAKEIPLGRFGEPKDIAVMIVWLASPLAKYITGQTVGVDGGITRGLI
ncbi:oxidoreductase [Terrihabitans soli]|uniref:Oxidoreductase n=1 Tax=Terrihabitans soli TaxID=708113 RepID=A0A6S6QYN7_9HYPH|nr:SDR family oxidoreductase [Terrihabitans soli]BCJ91698.1 oxidoreductase [Terrihabitans soli]